MVHRSPPLPRQRPAASGASRGALVAAAFAFGGLAACGGSTSTAEERYCGAVRDHLAQLSSPTISAPADVDAALAMYKSITASAPIAVQPEWQAMVDDLATAATVDPNDQSSMQKAADQARTSRAAATRIQLYTLQLCSLQIGSPVDTAPPTVASTSTTIKAKPKPTKTTTRQKPKSTTKPKTTTATTSPSGTTGGKAGTPTATTAAKSTTKPTSTSGG
jgi:hypothetical protein